MAPTTSSASNGILASALLMLLALLWLTVSTPFVYASQQKGAIEKASKVKDGQENNPLPGASEEKTETGVGSISEYLHEVSLPVLPFTALVKFEKCHPADLYFAFHPELHCPPPDSLC